MARKRQRRFWDDAEKRQIVAQTQVPGVSVSRVARRYDVNANLVFKWLRDPRFKPAEDGLPSFLPVGVVPETAMTASHSVALDSRIEITLSNGHRLTVSGHHWRRRRPAGQVSQRYRTGSSAGHRPSGVKPSVGCTSLAAVRPPDQNTVCCGLQPSSAGQD